MMKVGKYVIKMQVWKYVKDTGGYIKVYGKELGVDE